MKKVTGLISAALLSLLLAGSAFGQGVGSSGEVKGTVTDPQSAVLQHATVTVENSQTGLKRTAQTDENGEYRITNLPPATYRITVEGQGFAMATKEGLVVTVGETVTTDVQMQVSGAKGVVNISSDPPAIDPERGGQANTIEQKLIRDLPINRRDYLTYTLLLPGVSDSTRLASDQDFRVKQTPQSGLSFYGSNGRGNNVTVDGGEVNDDAGGVRPNLGQEAIQEFQVNRSNYMAELGGASGASVNIVSKSGTNDVRGSLFGLFRSHHLDARNPFSITQALQPGTVFNPAAADVVGAPVKDTLSRQQFGGSVGFPFRRDKTFGFLAFEGLRQNAQNAVPLLTNTNIFRPQSNQRAIISGLAALGATPVPCLTGQPALPASTCAGLLTSALTVSSTTGLSAGAIARSTYIIDQFERNGGLFDYSTRAYYLSGRVDHQASDRDQLFLRYNFAHDVEQNPDVQSLVGFSRGSSVTAIDNLIQGGWLHQFSSTTSNEARLQYDRLKFNVIPNVPAQAGIDLPGFGSFGTNIFLPSLTTNDREEFADNLTLIRGNHTMKLGGDLLLRGNHTESHTFFPGRFVFGNLPGGVLSPCLQVPAACGLAGVSPATIDPVQSFSLGAPQFYQQGFGDPNWEVTRPFMGIFWQDSWRIRKSFTLNFGLRYELDSQRGTALNTDKNNFAPRLSFAWDPWKDHKTVIRGGYGVFYSQNYAQIANVVDTLGVRNGFRQIPQVFVPLTGVPGFASLTSALIFQTLFAQGRVQCTTPTAPAAACITPADLTQFGPPLNNISQTGSIPPLTVIFSGQPRYQNPYSLQGEFGIEREVLPGFSVGGSYIYVHTLHLPVAIDINLLPAPFVPTGPNNVPIRQWSTSAGFPCAGANVVNCFVNPLLLQSNQYSSVASAVYHGGIFEMKQRFNRYASLLANYTISKAKDNGTDFNSDFAPFDQTNLAGERALSNFDQRHKLVIAGVLGSPWRNSIVSDWQLSPIIRYNSGHPFNLLAGSDVNGDRHSTNDRPPGAPRNSGKGPNYFDVDLRLARRFRINENMGIQLLAEGFNLFNRTNFATVNNVVGSAYAGSFNVKGDRTLSPSTPLGFTSTFPKRQFQLGVRLDF